MKNKYRNVIKSFSFILGLFVILALAPSILNISLGNGIENEPHETVDYLVVGDSEALTSISPMQIFDDHGYTGFNLGKSGQYIQNGYYNLLSALKTQHPKIVFVETNFIFRERDLKNSAEQSVARFFQNAFPIFDIHAQQGKKQLNDYLALFSKDKPGPELMKGFRFNSKTVSYTGGNYLIQTNEKKVIPETSRYYLDKINELSENEGFKLVLYSSPSPINWKYAVHNSIKEYALENGLEYLDYNITNQQIGIDWIKDTYDKGDHVNFSGAVKVTRSIGHYLKETGRFNDHRNDRRYDDWKRLLKAYARKTKD